LNRGVRMCLDCVSSIGTVPLDLSDVYLASGVSGKGLASCAGLSFVFYNHEVLSSNSIPRYLDIGFYAKSEGIPFTVLSNLIYALSAALRAFDKGNRYGELKEISKWARSQIRDMGINVIAGDDSATPALITISLPKWLSSSDLGQRLQDEGFLLHWRSQYLIERNWIQIAFMGRHSKDQLTPLFQFLSNLENPLSKAL